MSDRKELKVAIFGASGYTGQELVRWLLLHPVAELAAVTSRQYAGQKLSSIFPRFRQVGNADHIEFIQPDPDLLKQRGIDLAFLALPHGAASEYAQALLERGIRVIDLSADFRLKDPAVYQEFYEHPHPAPHLLEQAVYGLPEVRPEAIQQAQLIAAPGCYPTGILLPLIPLLQRQLIEHVPIHVHSMGGVSGAGRKESIPLLYAECDQSVRPYGAPGHRHLSEIEQELSLAASNPVRITFIPHLVPIFSGISTSIVCKPKEGVTLEAIQQAHQDAYQGQPLVRVLKNGQFPDTKNVRGTAFIDLSSAYDARTGFLHLFSAEDNLIKGAGGQGIQCMNLIARLPVETGLQFV